MRRVAIASVLFGAASIAHAGPVAFQSSTTHGFVYSGGTFTRIDVPESVNTSLTGINDAGRIVGYDGGSGQMFFYEAGIYTVVPRLTGITLDRSFGINDAGQVVGSFFDSRNRRHGFVYEGGIFTALDVPGAFGSGAFGINDAGQIVGSFSDASGSPHAFLYDEGTFTSLDVPGASSASALGINDAGQIVGVFQDASGNRGFLYTAGTFTILDAPGSVFTTFASGINDAGQIVGTFSDGTTSLGFLYNSGSYSVIDVPGREVSGGTAAVDINDAGQIVGSTSGTFGPVPEPGSMLLFGSGLVGIWSVTLRQRRSCARSA